jgi:hypothetical protein
LILSTQAGLRTPESYAVSADTNNGDRSWTKAAHLAFKPATSRAKFVVIEFVGRGCCASDKVGDPNARVKHRALLPRLKQGWRETAVMKRAPETVARASEV